MKTKYMASFFVILIAISGCKVDTPPGIAPQSSSVSESQTAKLTVDDIYLNYNPFRTSSQLSGYARSLFSNPISISNYAIHYSFNGTSFDSSLARLTNPTSIQLTSINGYRSRAYFVVGSQAVIDAKGSNDRVFIKIILTGEDSGGAALTYEFTTTWSI